MQIHELNSFNGNLNSAYMAVDDGSDTGKLAYSNIAAQIEAASDVLNARIDNIIAGGAAPSEDEIIDARFGYNGKTYSSLGNAIRGQAEGLSSEISDLRTWSGVNYVDNNINNWYQGNNAGIVVNNQISSNHFVLPLDTPLVFSRKTVSLGDVVELNGYKSDGTFLYRKRIANFDAATFSISSASYPTLSYFQLNIFNNDSSDILLDAYFAQDPEIQINVGNSALPYCPYYVPKIADKQIRLAKLNEDVISEIEKKRWLVTETEQSYLFELYLEGYDTSKSLCVGQVANKYPSGGGYYTGLYIAYADNPLVWIAGWSISYDIDFPAVVQIVEVGSSGVTGYAVVDPNAVPVGTRIYPAIPINSDQVDEIGKSPIIVSYLNGYNATDINTLNKDREEQVIQASKTRANLFPATNSVLEFVHFSDVHGAEKAWKRVVDYINAHRNYLSFGIMTGDYVISAQTSHVDLYNQVTPWGRPILNVVGNHDVEPDDDDPTLADKEDTYNLLFGDSSNWGVTFQSGQYCMNYYKDFASSKVRLIVIDQYYWDADQKTWLESTLANAKALGYHVITASHTQSGPFASIVDVPFNTIDDYSAYGEVVLNPEPFESCIKDFIDNGGHHIVHLCGHWHHDITGITTNGILNTVIECATPNGVPWVNALRIDGTKSYDCFNVVAVDTNVNVLKVIRIGNDYDGYLQHKSSFCINYSNKTVISR